MLALLLQRAWHAQAGAAGAVGQSGQSPDDKEATAAALYLVGREWVAKTTRGVSVGAAAARPSAGAGAGPAAPVCRGCWNVLELGVTCSVRCRAVQLPPSEQGHAPTKKRKRRRGAATGLVAVCGQCGEATVLSSGASAAEKRELRKNAVVPGLPAADRRREETQRLKRQKRKKQARRRLVTQGGTVSVAAAKALGVIAACQQAGPKRSLSLLEQLALQSQPSQASSSVTRKSAPQKDKSTLESFLSALGK